MGLITVRIDGIDELERKLGPGMVDGPINRFLDRGAITIQGKARGKAPVDTGRLRNSIGIESGPRERTIGPNVHYGPYVEFGTRPHWPPVSALSPWAERHGMNPYAVQRAIAARGTKAQPYLGPAAEESIPVLRSLVQVMAAEIEAEAGRG